jgi:hypothetical protein
MLSNLNGVEFTCIVTYAAFYALFLVQFVRLLFFTADRLLRALSRTHAASGAGLGIDLVMKQLLADAGRAFFVANMGFILIPEVKYGG